MTSPDINNHPSDYENLDLETFRYTDHKSQDIENDIDPENNFLTTPTPIVTTTRKNSLKEM